MMIFNKSELTYKVSIDPFEVILARFIKREYIGMA